MLQYFEYYFLFLPAFFAFLVLGLNFAFKIEIKVVSDGRLQSPEGIQVLQFLLECLLTRVYRHTETTLLEMLSDLALK